MGFANYGDIDPAKLHYSIWRKVISVAGTADRFFDDSMLANVPPANYYASAPLESAVLEASKGIRHWPGNGSNHSEHLLEVAVICSGGSNSAPRTFILADYVMYYPFIDGDSTDQQDMTQAVALPRFTTGVGLRIMLVAQGASSVAGTFTLSYTNQDGTAGRTSGTCVAPVAAGPGILGTSGGSATANQVGPFLNFQSGDHGVRSVESFTWSVAPGGIWAVVLVKPIAQFSAPEIDTFAETRFYPRMPEIHPDAFLGIISERDLAAAASRYHSGILTTIRS